MHHGSSRLCRVAQRTPRASPQHLRSGWQRAALQSITTSRGHCNCEQFLSALALLLQPSRAACRWPDSTTRGGSARRSRHRIAARELRQEAVSPPRRVIFLANRGAYWSMRAPDGRATALPYAPRPSGACSGRPRSSAEGDAGFGGSLLGPSADQRPPKAGTGRKRVYAIHTNSIKILH